MDVVGQAKRQIKRLLDVMELDREARDDRLGCLALGGDSALLIVVERVRNAVLVMLLEQLSFLLIEGAQLVVTAGDLPLGNGGHLVQPCLDGITDAPLSSLRELDIPVVALDSGLDDIDPVIWLIAEAALLVGADEILVGAAIAGVPRVGQPEAAVLAVQRALEVVGGVFPLPLAGEPMRLENGLDFIELRL